MAEWKDIYLSLMRDTEKAIRVLEDGQKKCEEMYLQDEGLNFTPGEPQQTADAPSEAAEAPADNK